MKEYIVEGSIKEWMVENTDEVFDNVLESCERFVGKNTFDIMKLVTITGVTIFKISNKDSVLSALNKCEKYFVANEEYEKAARTRDCSKLWQLL